MAEEFDPTITINEISDDKADLQSQEATTEVAEQGDRTKTFNEINYKIEQQTLEAPIEAAGDGMDAVDKMTKDVERVVLDADLTPTSNLNLTSRRNWSVYSNCQNLSNIENGYYRRRNP